MNHEALLYSTSKGGVCNCELCPRNCTILAAKSIDSLQKENVGFCGTRININGKLYAANYGRVTSLAADPSEKKPLFHFLPGRKLLSIGSFGCNLRCPNCHNWEISQTSSLIHSRPTVLEPLAESFTEISPAEIINNAIEHNCSGIAYTYNEPTVFLEFALEVMKLAKKSKLKNVWISNGYFSGKALEAIIPYIDAYNIDIKSSDQHFYQSHCKASISPLLDNLTKISDSGGHLEVTTLIIPGLNSEEKNLQDIANFIAKQLSVNTPWHLIDFSAPISWQMQEWQSTEAEHLEKAFRIGKEAGLRYIYPTLKGEMADTYCPNCKKLNIKRLGYEVERFDDNGTCFHCDQNLSIYM